MLKAWESMQLLLLTSSARQKCPHKSTTDVLSVKEAGNSFQHFSNSYTFRDEYCHCLTSDATIMVSYKFPIIGEQVAIIYFT